MMDAMSGHDPQRSATCDQLDYSTEHGLRERFQNLKPAEILALTKQEDELGRNFIHRLASNGKASLLRTCLSFLTLSSEQKLMLTKQDLSGDTPMHLAVDSDNIDTITCQLEFFPKNKLLDLLLTTSGHGSHKQTALHRTISNASPEKTIDILLQPLSELQRFRLLKVQDDEGETLLHKLSTHEKYSKAFACVLNSISSISTTDKFALIALNSLWRQENVLHILSGNGCVSIIHHIIETMKNLPDEKWIQYFERRNAYQETALELAISNKHSDTVECLLMSKIAQHADRLIDSVTNDLTDLKVFVVDIREAADIVCSVIKALSASRRYQFLTQTQAGETIFERAVKLKILKIIQCIGGSLNEEEIEAILKRQNADGETVIHFAACNDDLEMVQTLLDYSENTYSLLEKQDKHQQNALHVAAKRGHSKTLKKLLISVDSPAKRIALIKGVKASGENVFHVAVRNEIDVECVKVILEIIDSTPSKLKEFIILQDSNQSIFHEMAKQGQHRLVHCMLSNTNETTRDNILRSIDACGETALHLAARNGCTDVIRTLAPPFMSSEQWVSLLQIQNPENSETALHHAAKKGHSDIVHFILDSLDTPKQRSSLLSIKGFTKGETVLHSAVVNRQTETVICIVDMLSPGHCEQLLSIPNISGQTVPHLSSYSGFGELLASLLNKLSLQQRFDLSMLKDNKKNTILHIIRSATNEQTRREFEHVIASLKPLSADSRLELLTVTNGKFHSAAQASPDCSTVRSFSPLLESMTLDQRVKLFCVPDKQGFTTDSLAIHHITNEITDMSVRIYLLCHLEQSRPESAAIRVLLAQQVSLITQENMKTEDLLQNDETGDTILHIAARRDKYDLISNIIRALEDSKRIEALAATNKSGLTPRRLAKPGSKVKGLLNWSQEQEGFYLFPTPPEVLIMYTTENRPGAQKEKDVLELILPEFQVRHETKCDLKAKEMLRAIGEISSKEDISGLIIIIMSHGDKGSVCARDGLISITDILDTMNTPCLNGKPKILVLQACQDALYPEPQQSCFEDSMPALTQYRSAEGSSQTGAYRRHYSTDSTSALHFDIPARDFIVFAATINHGYANRNLMIPKIVEYLQKSRENEDLHEIFLKTSERIKVENQYQVPEYRTTMCQKVCLRNIFKPNQAAARYTCRLM